MAEVPFSLFENVIFFKAHLNDSLELNFMFDSGAGITVVNSSLASRLDLTYAGESVISTSGRKVKAKTATGNTLRMDGVFLEDLSLEVLYLDHLSEYFNTSVDGIIGYDLFSKFVLSVDVETKQIEIHQSSEDLDLAGWMETKLYPIDNNKVGIETKFLNQSGSFQSYILTVDTGAPDEIHLSPSILKDTSLALKITNKRVRGFSADTLITENLRGKLKRVSLSGRTWKNVPVVLPVDSISRAAFQPNDAKGFIGQALLLEFNMIYDYPNNRIFLKQRQ